MRIASAIILCLELGDRFVKDMRSVGMPDGTFQRGIVLASWEKVCVSGISWRLDSCNRLLKVTGSNIDVLKEVVVLKESARWGGGVKFVKRKAVEEPHGATMKTKFRGGNSPCCLVDLMAIYLV